MNETSAGQEGASSTDGAAADQFATFDAITSLLTRSRFDLDLLLTEITRIATERLQVKGCAIRLLDETSGEMVLRGAYGLGAQYLSKGPVVAARSAFREVIESGRITEIYDVSTDPRIQYSSAAEEEGIRSILTVGLLRDGRAIGALSVYTGTHHHFTPEETRLFQTISNQAAVAVQLAQLHRKRVEAERLEQELQIAAQIQARMMPAGPPTLPGLQIAARTLPCQEIGGDFFDFVDLGEEAVGLVIADVSGKGIPAALLMAMAGAMMRVQEQMVDSARELVEAMNWSLCRDTSQSEFVTLFFGILKTAEGRLQYVNAGHHYPFLFRGGECLRLESSGIPLGLFPKAEYSEEVVALQPGDLLVLYTDGFWDAEDAQGEQFGEARFIETIRKHRDLSARDLIRRLEQVVDAFEDANRTSRDDRTVVVVKIDPENS